MSEESVEADLPQATVVELRSTDAATMSTRQAAQALAAARHRPRDPETSQEPVERQDPAARDPATESAPEADAAPHDEVPGETEGATEPAERPPIEPPRSWTKEAKERWQSLPPETQEYLATREQERDRELRRGQNEAAEARKAIEAERVKAEQVRTQYEQALPALLQTIQQQQNAEFADIRTIEDVQRLAREDWPRYVMWDAQQKQIAAVNQQVEQAKQREIQERNQKLGEFVKREAELLAEKAPDLADPAKKTKLQESAVNVLRDLGFADQELGELWNGTKEISLHDHRLQLLLLDGVRYREAKAGVKPTTRILPPVQRPGVVPSRGAAADAAVKNLAAKLDQTGNLKDAARLLAARRAARG